MITRSMGVLGRSLLLFIMTLSISCGKRVSTKADLTSFVNDPENGLIKTTRVNQINAELKYKPWQLMAIGSNRSQMRSVNSFKNKYFFVLSLSAGNKELLKQLSFDQYSEMVQVLSFRMMTYIVLIPDRDKPVIPEDCLFQQTYGLARANQLLIVFDKTKLKKSKQLQIKIKEFGLGTGDLNFQFNTDKIQDL